MAHDLQTVRSSLVLCSVSDVVDWNDQTHAQCIASDLFDDDFQSFMDKTFSELDKDWKTYSSVTLTNGQIRLPPRGEEEHPRTRAVGEGSDSFG